MLVAMTSLALARPLAVIDLESTGVDPGRDRIVVIAVLAFIPGGEPVAFHARVNPGRPIPTAATVVHGIADADVAARRGSTRLQPTWRGASMAATSPASGSPASTCRCWRPSSPGPACHSS